MLRRLVHRIPMLLLVVVSGCSPSQGDVEKSIRDELKDKLSVEIASFDLKKQGDGSYLGTATAKTGDVYEITSLPPKGTTLKWEAVPGQALVEAVVRKGLAKQLATNVKTLELTRIGPGTYNGPAELETGIRLIVTTRMEGGQLLWEAKQSIP